VEWRRSGSAGQTSSWLGRLEIRRSSSRSSFRNGSRMSMREGNRQPLQRQVRGGSLRLSSTRAAALLCSPTTKRPSTIPSFSHPQSQRRVSQSPTLASRPRFVRESPRSRRRAVGSSRRQTTSAAPWSGGCARAPSATWYGVAELVGEVEPELGTRVEAARVEVREFARGALSGDIDQHGLAAAVRELGERSPVPVVVVGSPGPAPSVGRDRRLLRLLGGTRERGEAFAGVSRHDPSRTVGRARDASDRRRRHRRGAREGGGLRGLADRLEAVGGRLTVESPRASAAGLAPNCRVNDPQRTLTQTGRKAAV
jgi:hypothetical protein